MLAANPKEADAYVEVADYYDHRENGAAVRETLAAAARAGANSPRLDYYVGVAAVLAGNHYDEGEAALKRYLTDVPQRSGQPSHADAQCGSAGSTISKATAMPPSANIAKRSKPIQATRQRTKL